MVILRGVQCCLNSIRVEADQTLVKCKLNIRILKILFFLFQNALADLYFSSAYQV